ncbi:hypothetical protein GCM10009682_56150 [Luedemannella flava]|uniref:Uncharacterized protein n=1 Tax=Luedemannella flava TaxID=349316 RepID=A0ABP4YVW5_9ACTN
MKLTHAGDRHTSPECPGGHENAFAPRPGILVTETCLRVRGVCHPVSDLAGLSASRGRSRPSAQALSIAAACVAVIGVAAGMGANSIVGSGAIGAVTMCAVAGLGGGASYSWRTRPHELWVRCRGNWVLLYASRDAVAFGKVKRVVFRLLGRLGPATY